MNDWLIWILGALTSFVLGCAFTPSVIIPLLRRLKFGQQILTVDGPSWHKNKQGTPTMGGIVFIFSTVVSYLAWGIFTYPKASVLFGAKSFPSLGLTVLAFAFLYSLIGFSDDMTKIRNKRNLGLTAIQKIVLQTILGVLLMLYVAAINGFSTVMLIPFIGTNLNFSVVYYLIAILLIVGFVNAVNLTDGVDGLCTTVTIPVVVCYAGIGIVMKLSDLVLLSLCLLGGSIAYLIFNWHPAKIMMGDTGSLFLGAMVVGFAFAYQLPLLLIPIGIVYLWEALSVMIQVSYFKITHGKRLFKMTPIHHSFELSGYSEKQICLLFGGISFVGCALSFIFVFTYFN